MPDPSDKRKAVITNKQCPICTSSLRSEIDEQLALGIGYRSILKNLGVKGLDISPKSLANHKKKHFNCDAPIELVKTSVQAGIAQSHDRMFNLMFENQRLRSEAFLADHKLRMVQQAAVYLTIMDQLPNIVDQVKPSDVIAATKALSELMGDTVIRSELQVDLYGEMGLTDEAIGKMGDMLAGGKMVAKKSVTKTVPNDMIDVDNR